jgi:hypothetical protein
MDKHGIANTTPCPRPIVPHSHADSPHDQGGGCDDKDGEDMNGKKIVLPSHLENGNVNVIDAWRLRVDGCPINRTAIQGIVRDYSIIALISVVQ